MFYTINIQIFVKICTICGKKRHPSMIFYTFLWFSIFLIEQKIKGGNMFYIFFLINNGFRKLIFSSTRVWWKVKFGFLALLIIFFIKKKNVYIYWKCQTRWCIMGSQYTTLRQILKFSMAKSHLFSTPIHLFWKMLLIKFLRA